MKDKIARLKAVFKNPFVSLISGIILGVAGLSAINVEVIDLSGHSEKIEIGTPALPQGGPSLPSPTKKLTVPVLKKLPALKLPSTMDKEDPAKEAIKTKPEE